MIDRSFVDSIAERAAVQTFEVDGATFSSKTLLEVKPAPDPLPPLVKVVSLMGFADLITHRLEKLIPEEFIIHVENETTVALKKLLADEHGRRSKLIEASPVQFEPFKFAQWISQEEFIIAVSARFSQTDDKDYVLRIASSLTADASSISEDDGFSQKVTVKAGLRQAEIKELKPQVELAPFRTFPEVGQPISKFVFRARTGEGGPKLMLVEADGGKWKLDAINEIRRYLSTIDLGIAIVA